MGPSVRELLFTDFDGQPVDDPDDVITEAYDDPRYLSRIGPLRALLTDAAAPAYDRFLACCALASWGERDGYRAVTDAAAASGEVAWYAVLIDSRYSVDETFAQLASAIYHSQDMAQAKDTEADRLAALRALIGIADEQYFDWRLAFALDRRSLPHVIDALPEVIRRGIKRLSDGPKPSFDLGAQLAGLIAAMATVDEQGAVGLGTELVRVDTSTRTLIALAAVVSRGVSPASRTFAEYLRAVGGDQARQAVTEALAQRQENP